MEYLTPEDYKKAEQLGINRKAAYIRFYEYGWSKEEALTRPLKKRTKFSDADKEAATKNGVSIQLLHERVKRGWDTEKAANTPPRKQSNPYLAQSRANGITEKTYYSRIKSGWTKEEASTIPPYERRRA